MPKDLSVNANFGLLPEPEGRWGSFGVSMVTNLSIMALLVLLTAAVHKVEKQKYIEHMVFTEQTPPPPPPKIIVPKVKVIAPPPIEVVKIEPPKIVVPKIQPPPEMPKPVKLDQEQPKLPPAPPKAVAPPPQPKVGLFASAKPTEVANNQVKPDVKAGGFGDPIGAKTNANSTNSALVAVGSFNAAPGCRIGRWRSAQGCGRRHIVRCRRGQRRARRP